ncbi:hypothetical protein MKX03_023941 [Papaver bracteatum]|nr:hypothetical protein MKX03_023941 [Papaver bracteatum]
MLDFGVRVAARFHPHSPQTARMYYHPTNHHSDLQRQIKEAIAGSAGGGSTTKNECGCENIAYVRIGVASTEFIMLNSVV